MIVKFKETLKHYILLFSGSSMAKDLNDLHTYYMYFNFLWFRLCTNKLIYP